MISVLSVCGVSVLMSSVVVGWLLGNVRCGVSVFLLGLVILCVFLSVWLSISVLFCVK